MATRDPNAWRIKSTMEPDFDGGLIHNDFIKGTVFIRVTKAQRNSIGKLYRSLESDSTTICLVLNDNVFYKLINNPDTEATQDSDWEALPFEGVGGDGAIMPIGTWDANNQDPALTDSDASGINGNFYYVVGAPSPINVSYPDLFQDEEKEVVDNDMVMSMGDYWEVIKNTTTWEALNKPQVIVDYENGIVIAHSHAIADIAGLSSILASKYDESDLADMTLDYVDVPDAGLVNVAFLRKHFYDTSQLYTRDELSLILGEKADLVDGKVPVEQLPDQAVGELVIVADIAARDTLETYEGMRVLVIDASADPNVAVGSAEYVYEPANPYADSDGWVIISKSGGESAFNWQRKIATLPTTGQILRKDTLSGGIEKMFFGPVDPSFEDIVVPKYTVGDNVAPHMSGYVVPNGATNIISIEIVAMSNNTVVATITPYPIPTATPIDVDLPPVDIINGTSESYYIRVQTEIDGTTVMINSDVIAVIGVYPILYGFGTSGLDGAGLWGLTHVNDNENQRLNIQGNDIFYFAFPDTMDELVKSYDHNRNELLDALLPATPAVVDVVTNGLANDWTAPYKVYEATYPVTVDGMDWEFLWTLPSEADSGSGLTGNERAKLAGIEPGAQVNPDAAEVKTLYESNSNTNVFDNNYKTKVDGIEEGAEANPTGTEIKQLYEGNPDTNAFTDADKAAVSEIIDTPPGDMKSDEYAIPDKDLHIVNRATRRSICVYNASGITLVRGMYVDFAGWDSFDTIVNVVLADKDSGTDAVGFVDIQDIPIGGKGIVSLDGYNTYLDTTGQAVGTSVYLGQNGSVVFEEPLTGSDVKVGQVLMVGNPGVIGTKSTRELLASNHQPDWRANTKYPKHTKIAVYHPLYPDVGAYLVRTTKDIVTGPTFDPDSGDYEVLGGDMKTKLYDPHHIMKDAFNMSNMRDGTETDPAVKKVAMTQAERDKLANVEAGTFKGYFNTPDDLAAAYPTGQTGWSATVLYENDGTTPNGNLWSWDDGNGQWEDSGISSVGGNMNSGTYDPNSIQADAFNMDNFVEGSNANKRFFDDARKAKLDGLEEGSAYYNKTYIDGELAKKADTTYVDTGLNNKMNVSTYDPNGILGNVFDMANMIEAADAKILSAAERTNIANNTSAAHTHANKDVLDATEEPYTTADKAKLDSLQPVSFIMGSAYMDSEYTQNIGATFTKMTGTLTASAANTGLVVSGSDVSHGETGATYRCRVTLQVSINNANDDQIVGAALMKNDSLVAEGYGEMEQGGGAGTHGGGVIMATYTVDIADGDTLSIAVRSRDSGGTYTIYSAQMSITGFKL